MIGRIVAGVLYYGLGVGSAVLAMTTVLPSVKLASGDRPIADPAIRHALIVEETCPGVADGSAPSCPYPAATARGTGCPYVAAVAARSGCPVLRGTTDGTSCPFLNGRRGADGDSTPLPQNVSPAPDRPESGWLPEGTVLALGPAPEAEGLL